MTRQQDTLTARQAADDWAAENGLPESGGYSGQWFQDGYLGGWWPEGWLKWWAAYGIAPGSILGDDIVAHQWTSTPVDQNVMLESEIVGSGGTEDPVTDPEREALQKQIGGLVTTVADMGDRIGDALLAELKRKPSARVTIMRGLVKQLQDERVQAVGPRP